MTHKKVFIPSATRTALNWLAKKMDIPAPELFRFLTQAACSKLGVQFAWCFEPPSERPSDELGRPKLLCSFRRPDDEV